MKTETELQLERLLPRVRFSPNQPDTARQGGLSLSVTVWPHAGGARFDALFDVCDATSAEPLGAGVRLVVRGGADEFESRIDRRGQAWFRDLPADEYSARLVELADAVPSFSFHLLESPLVQAVVTGKEDATARLRLWTDDAEAIGRVLTIQLGEEEFSVVLVGTGEEHAQMVELASRYDTLERKRPRCTIARERRIVVMPTRFATMEDAAGRLAARSRESLAAAPLPDLPRTMPRQWLPIPGDSELRVELRDYAGEAWLFSLSYESESRRLAGGTLRYAVGGETGCFELSADGDDKAKGAVKLAQSFAEAATSDIRIEFTPAGE